jgi:hypothetical protein
MPTGKGQVLALILEDGLRHLRVSCPAGLIPAPGQYLLAADRSDMPVAVPLFYTDSVPQGFIAAGPVPGTWFPGTELDLRGPLGRSFRLPPAARKVGLVALEVPPARLHGLIRPALGQQAGVALVCDVTPEQLPDEVEVQPVSALREILEWCDYVAIDARRETLNQMWERLDKRDQFAAAKAGEILIRTPVPCGGAAGCGVCAVRFKSRWRLACKDGPVFDWSEFRTLEPGR